MKTPETPPLIYLKLDRQNNQMTPRGSFIVKSSQAVRTRWAPYIEPKSPTGTAPYGYLLAPEIFHASRAPQRHPEGNLGIFKLLGNVFYAFGDFFEIGGAQGIHARCPLISPECIQFGINF